ncbi:hypothetical protein EJB05_52751, partial [Eragrostis curvula]
MNVILKPVVRRAFYRSASPQMLLTRAVAECNKQITSQNQNQPGRQADQPNATQQSTTTSTPPIARSTPPFRSDDHRSRADRAPDESVLVALIALERLLALGVEHLAAAVAVPAHDEAHAGAARAPHPRARQAVEQRLQLAVLLQLGHLGRPADVLATDEHGRDAHLAPAQQQPQLLPVPRVHGHVPLDELHVVGLERRAHRVALLEGAADAAERGGVEDDRVGAARRALALGDDRRRRRLRPTIRLMWAPSSDSSRSMDARRSGSNSGLRLRRDDDMPPPPPPPVSAGFLTTRALPGENLLDALDSLELSMELYGRSTRSLSTSPGLSLLTFTEQRWSGLFSFPGVFFFFAADLLGDGRAMARTLAGDHRPGLDGFFAGDPAAASASSSPAMISHALITSGQDSGFAAAAGFLAFGTTRGGGRTLARFHSLLIGFSCSGGGCCSSFSSSQAAAAAAAAAVAAAAAAPFLGWRSRTP